MRKHILLLGAMVLFFLPVLGLSDGWGRCEAADCPVLDKVQAKIAKLELKCADKVAKLEEKIAELQEKHEEKLAELEDLLAEAEFFAEFFGDFDDLDWVAEIEEKIQDLMDKYDLKQAKLYDKIVETQRKYDCKVLKMLLKNGIIPPPDE